MNPGKLIIISGDAHDIPIGGIIRLENESGSKVKLCVVTHKDNNATLTVKSYRWYHRLWCWFKGLFKR